MDDPHDDDAQSKIIRRQPVLAPPAPPVPSTTSSVSGLDASTLREFLEIAKRDIEIRQQEIDLQRQEKANSHEYSKLALDAQVTDMKVLGLVLIAGYGGYQYAARKFSKSDSE